MTIRHAILLSVSLLVADLAQAAILCRAKGDRLVVRESCRKRERPVDPATFAVAGPAGAPGVQGEDGAPATSPLRLVDANGTELGKILYFFPGAAWVEIGPPIVPASMVLVVSPGGFLSDNNALRYTSTDCSGIPFMRPNTQHEHHVHPPLANVYGAAAYYGTGEPRNVTHHSTEHFSSTSCTGGSVPTTRGTCCSTSTGDSTNVVPTARVLLDELGLVTPFRAVPR
jgi:hypothetical protein